MTRLRSDEALNHFNTAVLKSTIINISCRTTGGKMFMLQFISC